MGGGGGMNRFPATLPFGFDFQGLATPQPLRFLTARRKATCHRLDFEASVSCLSSIHYHVVRALFRIAAIRVTQGPLPPPHQIPQASPRYCRPSNAHSKHTHVECFSNTKRTSAYEKTKPCCRSLTLSRFHFCLLLRPLISSIDTLVCSSLLQNGFFVLRVSASCFSFCLLVSHQYIKDLAVH